jgi:hypothetical protein
MNEDVHRQNMRILLQVWKESFPNLQPPAANWWALWTRKYHAEAIYDTVTEIAGQKRPPKTTDDVGRAISALLRDGELMRVINEEMGEADAR